MTFSVDDQCIESIEDFNMVCTFYFRIWWKYNTIKQGWGHWILFRTNGVISFLRIDDH